ncbi:MAG: hypothetical protein JKY71_06345 [Alphaproteobacteria bacterium]|nr:hypothetical protein [Alphaproteobacteria bacterium]
MQKVDQSDHHLITVYGDCEEGVLQKIVSRFTPEKDTRVLCPNSEESLIQAARNSSLIIVCIDEVNHKNSRLARILKDDRMVVAEIIAILRNGGPDECLNLVSKGFSLCLQLQQAETPEFEKIIKHRLRDGGKRLGSMLIEEEFRQFSEALSNAPISIIVFDSDKRIVFVSEHYYRAYPKSAPRLIRGLSVYETFEMMREEERLLSNDPEELEEMKRFWYSLSGDIEFTLENRQTYHSRAVPLASGRGTIVTTHNITPYVERAQGLEQIIKRLQEKANVS